MSLEPWWVVGFVDGEGSFNISVHAAKARRWRYARFAFSVAQKERSILEDVRAFFRCGIVVRSSIRGAINHRLVVTRASDLSTIIIPFFDSHPFQTRKAKDYALWRGAFIGIGPGRAGDDARGRLLDDIRSQMNPDRQNKPRRSLVTGALGLAKKEA